MKRRNRRNTAGGMMGGSRPTTEARDMLAIFASVGARKFDLTITNISGHKVFYKGAVPFADLHRDLPAMLDTAERRQNNVIIRPTGAAVSFVQLDDLTAEKLAKLTPAVFLTLQTSPGNYQAWVALPGAEDKDFSRRLRKGTGADATASGATRIAGSLNFKEKYAPNFPRVRIEHQQPGQKATIAGLDQLGLVAPREEAPARPARSRDAGEPRAWPDYARCLENAPPSQSRPGHTRDSIADFTWCMIALDWGWSHHATAARLMEESAKAKENGERYAARTVESAAAAVARRALPRATVTGPRP